MCTNLGIKLKQLYITLLYIYINIYMNFTCQILLNVLDYIVMYNYIHTILINLISYILLWMTYKILTLYIICVIYNYKFILFYTILEHYNYNLSHMLYTSIILNYLNSNYTVYIILMLILCYYVNFNIILIIIVIYLLDLNFLSYNSIIYLNTNYNILLDNVYFYIHPLLLYTTVVYSCICWLKYNYLLLLTLYNYKIQYYNYYIIVYKFFIYALITLLLGSIWAFIENTWGGFWVWDYSECVNFNLVYISIIYIHLFTYNNIYKFYYVYNYSILYNIYLYIYVKYFMLDSSHMFSQLLFWYSNYNWIILVFTIIFIIYKYTYILYIYKYNITVVLNIWVIYYIIYFYSNAILSNIILFNLYNYALLYIYHIKIYLKIKYISILFVFNLYWLLLYIIIIHNLRVNIKLFIIHISVLSIIYVSYLSKILYISINDINNYFNYTFNWSSYILFYINNINTILQLKNIIQIYDYKIFISLYTNIITDIIYIPNIKINIINYSCVCNQIYTFINYNNNNIMGVLIDNLCELLYSYIIIIVVYVFLLNK